MVGKVRRKGKEMKKGILSVILASAFIASSCMTVCAAPQAMPDGGMFDAAYYAQSNPDVVAVFGADENELYQHYVQYGKQEGRKATATETVQSTPEGTGGQSTVGANGEYIVPVEQMDFPDAERTRKGNMPQKATYKQECVKAEAARLANGTLQRVPVGSVILRDTLRYNLWGYDAEKAGTVGDKEYVVITADNLMERIARDGVQETVAYLAGMDMYSAWYLDNYGGWNYSTDVIIHGSW